MKMNRLTCALALVVLGLVTTAAIGFGQEGATRQDVGPNHITPNDAVGPAVGAADVWSLQCGAGTSRARADVLDLGGVDGIRFNVVLTDGHGPSVGTTAPDGGLSGSVVLARGPGNYLVIVTRTAGATTEPY